MRISHSSYKKYIEQIKSELVEEKLYSPVLLNNKTLLFPFMEKNKEVLFLSLNPKCPMLAKTKNDLFFSSFENSFLLRYRKYVGKSIIRNIELKEDDLVILLDLYSLDNLENFTLIIELIPNNPNLYLLNEEQVIIDHYFNSKNRPLQNGDKFIPLTNEKLIDGELKINDALITSRVNEEIEIRSKEKYAQFQKYLSTKLNALSRRIKAVNNDLENANKNLKYQEIADDIFASGLDLKSHQKDYKYQKEIVKFDEAKSLLENAQNFYKKAKKARATISNVKTNIDNIEKEQNEIHKLIDEFYEADERKKDEIMSIYFVPNKKKETKPTVVNRPWKVNLNGTIIYFGRNASQNDYLSFVMKLDREFTWLHIKDKSGSHLVIANKKPTENELLTAGEISLLCSRATAGEISYTKKKNVRRGHVLGEAILKNYSLMKINNIRKETIELFSKAVRLD